MDSERLEWIRANTPIVKRDRVVLAEVDEMAEFIRQNPEAFTGLKDFRKGNRSKMCITADEFVRMLETYGFELSAKIEHYNNNINPNYHYEKNQI